jgi:hypothetical protein
MLSCRPAAVTRAATTPVARSGLVLSMAACLLLLQGCGLISVTRAGLEENRRVERLHRDCPKPGKNAHCDHELVLVTPPPLQMSRAPAASAPSTRAEGPVEALRHARGTVELARVLAPMAYLANVVYHRHETGDDVEKRTAPEACHRGIARSRHPLEIAPASDTGGWRRWENADGCAVEGGLFYDTFIREPMGLEAATHPVLLAIVFRGTENTRGQFADDWTDNVLSAMGLTPRQYATAIEKLRVTQEALGQLKKRYEDQGRVVEIYAAGHSLGGGLAQQAGYLYGNISAVFAFNTSPVTNWTQLRLWDEGRNIQNPDPVIFRIEQQGEFLDYLRFVTTRVNLRKLARTDIEFNFGSPGAFSGHSIASLTCHLAARAAQSSGATAGPLGFTPDGARRMTTLSGVEGFACEKGALESICKASPYLDRACRPQG